MTRQPRRLKEPQLVQPPRPAPSNYPDDPQALAASLRLLALRVCGYDGDRCDCKYGLGESRSSEQTGCPEASAAAAIVSAMTPAEYVKLVARAQKNRRLPTSEQERVKRRSLEKLKRRLGRINADAVELDRAIGKLEYSIREEIKARHGVPPPGVSTARSRDEKC